MSRRRGDGTEWVEEEEGGGDRVDRAKGGSRGKRTGGVHSQKKRFHRAPFCYKMVLERSAPARVHVIGTFDKTKVPDANLQLGLRCPPSRGAGGEPKIVLTGDHTQNLRTIVSNFSSF